MPYILLPKAEYLVVVARIAGELALDEGHVEYGRVEIDKLEDEHLEYEIVLEVGLRLVHF